MTPEKLHEEAMAFQANGDSVGCIQALNKVLLLKPDYTEAWNNRASMLLKLNHPFDAVMNYDKALELQPDTAEIYNNRGVAWLDLGKPERAIVDYDKAIELKPRFEHALMNRGNAWMKLRKTEQAIESYQQSIEVNPNYVDAHLGLAYALLEVGDFPNGFREYEWRWKSPQLVERGLNYPLWDGSEAKSPDDVLLFYGEQGYGDTIHFMRYAASIKQKWKGKLVLEVRAGLARIAKRLEGADKAIALGEQIPENIKFILPMMTAPLVMGTTLETIPNKPYIHANEYRASIWRKSVDQLPKGLKIGLCWSGGARPTNPIANAVNQKRSTTLQAMATLAIPGVSFVSLQMGPEAFEVHIPPRGMTILDPSGDILDFFDTAALVENLDLVITVDTSVVHLAGAMNKPTWLLSRHDNCWRWLRGRKDSPWYPSVTQFIQPSPGDWESMFAEVRDELLTLVSQRKAA